MVRCSVQTASYLKILKFVPTTAISDAGSGMPWPQTGATQSHAQLGLPDKGHAIKGLVVCNNWDLEPLDLLNGLLLGCYRCCPEVLIVFFSIKKILFFTLFTVLIIMTFTYFCQNKIMVGTK